MENELSYHQQGEGLPIVLLHGFCETKEIWEHFMPILASETRVIAVDLPGFGLNSTTGSEITIDLAAEKVHSFLHSLGIDKAIIVGHSLGGYVALALADLFPTLISGLCLFHSTAKADTIEKKAIRDKTISFLEENGLEPFAQNFVPSLFTKKNHQKLSSRIDEVKQMVIQTPLNTAISYTKAMRDRSERLQVLELANYPCLFIAGKEDQAVPYGDLLEQSKLPKGYSKLISLDNCAHMGMYEHEKLSQEALLKYVKTLKSLQ